jgi:hypothetical protein
MATGVVRCGSDRGAAEMLGLVLMTPMVVGVAVLIVMLGLEVDRNALSHSAAAAAAQAAALERNRATAQSAAIAAVRSMIDDDSICPHPDLRVDLDDHRAGGSVDVVVRCGSSVGTSTASVDRFRWSEP